MAPAVAWMTQHTLLHIHSHGTPGIFQFRGNEQQSPGLGVDTDYLLGYFSGVTKTFSTSQLVLVVTEH